eukprot:Seg9010.1 transcript_id=Seg9010.1/GoldUCD/mRNA.D3Y31 product="hypothetical protein" protein_id=Seg9010.1/GoldUCD/D3Y31
MNQMDHNVKIKDYKKDLNPGPLAEGLKGLDYARNHPSFKEQERLMNRFKDFHWERQKVLTVQGHGDQMSVLRHHANDIEERQAREINDYEQHRIQHLEGIKDNIETTRERFWRRTELDRKVNLEENGENKEIKPSYKIANDGVPIIY